MTASRQRRHRATVAEPVTNGWKVSCACGADSYGDTPRETMIVFEVHVETATFVDELFAERFGVAA
jgi:hypothetical protein